MLAYASFGLAFVARPVGAVLFGHFGDRIGRKSTLVASLVLMGGSTVAIAFLPTYAQAGWIAPLLLRSEEHTSELQSLMRISYAVFCLKKKNNNIESITHRKQHTMKY